MANFYGTSGIDTLVGTSGNDVFQFDIATFNVGDRISGGDGIDTLLVTTAGSVTAAMMTGVGNDIERIRLANYGNNSIDVIAKPQVTVIGGNGNDTVSSGRLFILGGGNDTASRVDSIQANGGEIDANDHVFGLQIGTITIASAGSADLTNISGFTNLKLLASSGTTTVTLGATTLVARGQGPYPVPLFITAGAGDDVIDASASSAALTFDTGGGSDTLTGGSGYNVFSFAIADLDASDRISPGRGFGELDLTTVGTVTASALSGLRGIERIILATGDNTIDASAQPGIAVYGTSGNDTIANAGTVVLGNNERLMPVGTYVPNYGGDDHLTNIGALRAFASEIDAGDVIAGNGTGGITLSVGGPADMANVSGFTSLDLTHAGSTVVALGSNTLTQGATISGAIYNDTVDGSRATAGLVFDTGSGDDLLTGGKGDDLFTFAVEDFTSGDRVIGGDGIDTLQFTTAGSISGLALASVTGIERIVLAPGGNSLDLSAMPQVTVIGSDGDDIVAHGKLVVMGGGDDRISSVDSIRANGGEITADDHVTGLAIGTITIATAGVTDLTNVSGFETVDLSATTGANTVILGDYTLASRNQHILTVTGGSGADRIDASAMIAGITIDAGAGNDTLISGHGLDRLVGGRGNDSYYVNDSHDAVIEKTGEGVDTVYASVSYDIRGQSIEKLVLTGAAAIDGIGNALANTITGNAGDNRLTGGAGADSFYVTTGHDTITDFTAGSAAGHDMLAVDHRLAADYGAAMAIAHQVGSDVVFGYDAANSLTLHDVALASLVQGDFTFF